MTLCARARSSAVRRGRIAAALLGLAVLGAGSLTTAGPAAAETTPVPIQTDGVWGIDYAGGFLTTVERMPNGLQWVVGRRISADGSAVLEQTTRGIADSFAGGAHVQRVPCDAGKCVPMRSFGNTWVGYFFDDGTGRQTAQIHLSEDSRSGTDEPAVTGGRFVDATGRYYVYNAASTGKQYVDDVDHYYVTDVRRTRAITAASVWGSALWTPGTGNGTVTAYNLVTKKTAQVSTGAPCMIKELQVIGRWIYWNCGPAGAAGVYDRTAKKNIKVPSGAALVGDGYLVRHDRSVGKLMLTDYHTGAASAPRAVADLPAGSTADQRRQTWTVDKFGGDIAYVGPDKAIRIVPSGVPSQPLAMIDAVVGSDGVDPRGRYGVNVWDGYWQLNKGAHWAFTVKDAQGRVERTIKGSGASVDLSWDLKTDAGTYPYNGRKTWSLRATAAEGAGTYTTGGTLGYAGGLMGHHDQVGYSYGELATLNSSGTLGLYGTDGKGTFDWRKVSAAAWPSGTYAVPFGDMDTDRCAEMLMRMPNGELRRYRGKCGYSYSPSDSHTSLGTGWKAYNVLTSPGDLTGDGRPDLLARKASTGDIHLFANGGSGKLQAGVRIASGWSIYDKVVGAGDLTGDRVGDVLVRDRAGTLWRYDGTGAGRLKGRVKVFSNWGGSYNAVVGVGDITGDAKNDLVARDTAGNLYRQAGTGRGSFGARVKIATGWQGYKGLF